MKRLFQGDVLSPLCGLALASLVGAGMAHAQLAVTDRTLGGPADVTVLCDGSVRPIYQSSGTKVCVTLQNSPGSPCIVTVDLLDYLGATMVTQAVGVGESATLCANKVKTINTTPGSGGGSVTYHWRVDSY